MSEVEEVRAVLTACPGRTPTELRDALRAQGRVSMTAADVSSVLSAHPHRFRPDGGEPRRWWLAGSPEVARVVTPRLVAVPSAPAPLYAWQVEALEAWRRHGHRGVVEAVTGAGKTMIGVAAAAEELARGGQVCVLVPTTELLRQWRHVLDRHLSRGVSVGLLGGGHQDSLGHHDVLVSVVNSARSADLRPRRPGGLLVADECHRYGSDGNRVALEARFPRRLGLSATYARGDDGHLTWLDPYFTGTCYRVGYRRAIADGVVCRFRLALVGVAFEAHERAEYDELRLVLSSSRAELVHRHGVPGEPVGAFFEAVSRLARSDEGDAGDAARRYLRAVQDRRRLLGETPAKLDALRRLVPALRSADRSIVFTQTIAGAEGAAGELRYHSVRAESIHSGLDRSARADVLSRFGDGDLQVVTAPQVLDEGVDVPAADLAVILAASRSRRQMVQRMGRVLRPKRGGGFARFVVVFVESTVEDPAEGAHEGFLDEVTGVADAVRRLPSGSAAGELAAFLQPAPAEGS